MYEKFYFDSVCRSFNIIILSSRLLDKLYVKHTKLPSKIKFKRINKKTASTQSINKNWIYCIYKILFNYTDKTPNHVLKVSKVLKHFFMVINC